MSSYQKAAGTELALLIAKQRDQRRYDDRRAVEQQRGDLVDEGLAEPGRHHNERVPPSGWPGSGFGAESHRHQKIDDTQQRERFAE
jgi:hypothetical protein